MERGDVVVDNHRDTNSDSSPAERTAECKSKCKAMHSNSSSDGSSTQWSFRETNLENTPDQIVEYKNKFRTSTDSDDSNIPFSHHSSSINSSSTSPEQLGEFKARGKKDDRTDAITEACLTLDNCIKRDGLGNGITPSEGEDEGGYYGDSDDEIIDVVYAFADYTLGDDDEHQLSFKRGDKLDVLVKDDPDWWWGKKGDTYGYIATNHVKDNPVSAEEFGANSWQDEEYFGSYGQMRLHMEMLDDYPRTDTYKRAIEQNKRYIKDKVVLDVGCGSGILSLFCAKYGQASKVYAVEASEFAEHTKKLVAHNGLSEKITVIQGKVEDIQLPERVDLIISEWMGTFLLFEWMIECVLHARDCWLNVGGVMWPSHAHVYLVPCTASRQLEKLNFWNSVHSFDFSPLLPVAKQEFFGKPVYNHNVEPGSCLSHPLTILHVDMKTVTINDLEVVANPFAFVILQSGIFHGFSSWFSVDFCGFPSNGKSPVVLNTGPDYPETHWKQDFFMMDDELQVDKGDTIEGMVTISRNQEWKRHLKVKLDFTVSTKAQGIKSYKKIFPIWR